MNKDRIFLSIMLFANAIGISAAPVMAAETRFYSFDSKIVQALILKGGKMFVSSGVASDTGLADETVFNALVQIRLGEKEKCRTTQFVDVGVEFKTTTCVRVTRNGVAYQIAARESFNYLGLDYEADAELLDVLKGYDFVKSRKIEINVIPAASGCTAIVVSRSYVPLDGKSSKPSKTGPVDCRAKSEGL